MAQVIQISDIQLFTILKGKLGEKEAEQLVMFVKAETERQADEKYKYFSQDLENVKKEIISHTEVKLTEAKADLSGKIADSKAEMLNKIATGNAEMLGKIADSKAEMIKWVFVFVFTSTLTTIASIIAIIKFIK
jgi:hypothetical protein